MNLLDYEDEIKSLEMKGWILSEFNSDKAKWVKSNRTIDLYYEEGEFNAELYKNDRNSSSIRGGDIDEVLDSISEKFK